jgi:NADH pyrophosphatase NudC (nudix superfamily)
MKEFIDKKLAAFGYGKIRDLIAIVKILETEKVTLVDLIKWVDEQEAAAKQVINGEAKEMDRVLKKFAICPDCGARMEVQSVIGGAIRTRFACTQCDLALDSTEPPSKFIQRFIAKEKEDAEKSDPKKQK